MVPESPVAHTSVAPLPHTPWSTFVVPVATLDQVLPFEPEATLKRLVPLAARCIS
jgi:hypothetical protein